MILSIYGEIDYIEYAIKKMNFAVQWIIGNHDHIDTRTTYREATWFDRSLNSIVYYKLWQPVHYRICIPVQEHYVDTDYIGLGLQS